MQQRKQFIRAQFYGSPKVHKNPLNLWPVVSKCGTELEVTCPNISLTQASKGSQQPRQILPSYLQDSWELLDDMKQLPHLPGDARLSSINIVSMYVNIDTNTAIDVIGNWYKRHWETFKRMGLPSTEFILKGLNQL